MMERIKKSVLTCALACVMIGMAASVASAQETTQEGTVSAEAAGEQILSKIEAQQEEIEKLESEGEAVYEDVVAVDSLSQEARDAAAVQVEAISEKVLDAEDELFELEDELDSEGTPEQRADYFGRTSSSVEREAGRYGSESFEATAAVHGYLTGGSSIGWSGDDINYASELRDRAEDLTERAETAESEVSPPPEPEPSPEPESEPASEPVATPSDSSSSSSPSSSSSSGGGGINPMALLLLLLVGGGVAAVYGPRLLEKYGGGGKLSEMMASLRKPMSAQAENVKEESSEAPRMGPWKPEPDNPSPDFGPIHRVPKDDPDPTPDNEPPTVPSPDPGLDSPPEEPSVPPSTPPTAPPKPPPAKPKPTSTSKPPSPPRGNPQRTAPSVPRAEKPKPPSEPASDIDDDEMTEEELAYFFPAGVPAKAMSKTDREAQEKLDKAEEKRKLRELPERLRERTIGQDHAVEALASGVQSQRLGFGGERPVSVMFAGTTGVGKTEMAKALADSLFTGEEDMIRLDMSEYMDKLQASRFVGAPPGYVGYEETPELVKKMLEDPKRVVLFDEIEKAHPEILNYLLQILDAGRLTSSKGDMLDFRQAVVILTTNLGSEEIRQAFESDKVGEEGIPERDMKELLRDKEMRPELVARIGEIVTFRPLDHSSVIKIARLLLRKTQKQMSEANGIEVYLTRLAAAWVASRGYEPENGARPLRGAIQKYVERPLAQALMNEDVTEGDVVTIDVSETGESLELHCRQNSDEVRGDAME